MLSMFPTAAWPFLFAILAAIAATLIGRQRANGALQLASGVLFAVAVACAIIGVITVFLDRAT